VSLVVRRCRDSGHETKGSNFADGLQAQRTRDSKPPVNPDAETRLIVSGTIGTQDSRVRVTFNYKMGSSPPSTTASLAVAAVDEDAISFGNIAKLLEIDISDADSLGNK
jgi:hypothetical protein